MANPVCHAGLMDELTARALLATAATKRARTKAADDIARLELYAVVRQVADHLKQAEIVRATGWTREHIRKLNQ